MKKLSMKNDKIFNLFSAIVAFVIWGSWAYYINEGTVARKLYSGIAQGCASFTITLLLIWLVTKFYCLFPKKNRFLLFPTIFTAIVVATSLVIIHSLIQTPNILYTIAPSMSMSLIFSFLITLKLKISESEKHLKK